jgi:hypothetical protein
MSSLHNREISAAETENRGQENQRRIRVETIINICFLDPPFRGDPGIYIS